MVVAREISVNPIIAPMIAWDTILKDTVKLTGRSPTRGMDASGQNLKEYAKFIVALEEFRVGKPLNPLKALKNAEHVLRHIQFGFLITGPSHMILQISEITDLSVVSGRLKEKKGRVAIVTGNLREWRSMIVEVCANLTYSADLRLTANTCLEFFYSIGLDAVFKNYSRRILPDGTYLLEHSQ